ncbi:MAG: 2,4-dihydroxyhept-2-ene,7-dioic acid aldolase [Frankiales bacterium]|nr:2,4-dihydroxyhept-2-ene,7-dioic acid aldolase [Frankiales bacterium]
MIFAEARSTFDKIASQQRPATGVFINSTDAATTAIAADAGFDFVVIDGEHGRATPESITHHVWAARAGGVLPVIRVLECTDALIQQAMDLGAAAVMIPKAESAEHVRRAVAMTKYQPGGRGFCSGVVPWSWSRTNWTESSGASDRNAMIIPMIETAAGLQNADAIAAVDGVDLVFLGPADLSQELGYAPFGQDPRLKTTWDAFAAQMREVGARVGTASGFGLAGADFETLGMDLMTLNSAMRAQLDQYRARTEEA